jgi:hypothetical protein
MILLIPCLKLMQRGHSYASQIVVVVSWFIKNYINLHRRSGNLDSLMAEFESEKSVPLAVWWYVPPCELNLHWVLLGESHFPYGITQTDFELLKLITYMT